MSANDAYRALWAKSDPSHPLWKHMFDASAVSLALPNPLERLGWQPELVALFVGLHDVGKADPHFQFNVLGMGSEPAKNGFGEPDLSARGGLESRHERHSRDFIRCWLSGTGVDEQTVETLAQAIGWHHARWHADALAPIACGLKHKPAYLEARESLLGQLIDVLGLEQVDIPTPDHHGVLGMRLSGHVVLCDWIASNPTVFQPPLGDSSDNPEDYFRAARTEAERAVSGLELGATGDSINPKDLIPEGFAARPLQQSVLDFPPPPGLVIVEAPMGEGKTEAAWMIVEQWRRAGAVTGAYMALPTMATSDSLYRRYVSDYLDKHSGDQRPRLIHGMAWLRDDNEPGSPPALTQEDRDAAYVADSWFRPTRKAMLAQHGIGTVDQAMLAAMNAKFSFLRLYGLASKALIIDEVHAYDAYMGAILKRLLAWCAALEIPVILLSATLSSGQRREMLEAYGAVGADPGADAPYPLMTTATVGHPPAYRELGHDATREITVTFHLHVGALEEATQTARLAESLTATGGCCCVILNTVRQAQAVYAALGLPKNERTLFHARFKFEDRERLAEGVLAKFGKDRARRPHRHVVVATQVVEQSLDVDFDFMVTQVAPVDLLLQRCGRLHRHQRRVYPPELHVLMPVEGCTDLGGTGYVYAGKPLLRTLGILSVAAQARLPQDFRELVERCYGVEEWEQSAVPWEDIRKADEKWVTDNALLEGDGRQYAYQPPSKRAFVPVNTDPTGDDNDDGTGWRAKTRHGATDRTAMLVTPEEAIRFKRGELRMPEVRRLYRRAVKVACYLPLDRPSEGYSRAISAEGKLRGLLLIPVGQDGVWRGTDLKGIAYTVGYDDELGLLAGRAA